MERRISSALMVILVLSVASLSGACGSGPVPEDEPETGETSSTETGAGETNSQGEREQASEGGLVPAEATVGPEENSNMLPAGGAERDPAQRPPENPPEGVETFAATTNDIVEGKVDYERTPPTNGDHAALWQNCGFYEEPVRDENAVHTLGHGGVWITYTPDLPRAQIETLRSHAEAEYVLVSPYPGQDSPVVATAWRNQLRLDGAGDPRLDKFVEQFRLSQTAPLSGNGCTGGVGEPA